ncbi:hypothetical protein WJX72_004839 [[Myrmecia] bisecta]|uniref:Nudix hydrolase domain-containing protein n=1 Tax=[Myrmecia] bisecta TaxID=41462 RepID=A0AAW1R5K3_9CHLO
MVAKRLPDQEILEDLCSRFILNGAQEDLESFERLMFTIEQAHWFYEDFFREKDLTLKSLSLKDFTALIFTQCPGLQPYARFAEDIYKRFTAYKQKVAVLGAIILNPAMDKVLMVRGYKSGASWTFPRGKISKAEADAACAIREVEEETALNISPWLVEEDFIEMHLGEQRCKLYIITGVQESQQFAPLARKEIGGFGWYHIAHLPATKEADSLIKNKFFNVYPFVKQLRRWIKNKRRSDADQLVSVTDPEEQPYKSKYAAAETLAACRKQLQPFLTSNDPSEQVYGLLSEEDKSAAYCGATLQGQLKQGALDAADWVRNATQLASFYMRKEEFAVAEHVLLAGSAVMERARNEEHAVDAEASANLALGWARLYLQRLATSRAEKERGEGLAVGKLQEVPDALRFDSLSLEAPAKLPWGTAALARDLEAAKGLFNASMRHFKIALEYFLLDGYVTEHCNILMHISSLYSSLAEFEPDVHHKCILHKARCKRVEPVLAQLNEAAFPGLCWSMRLEVANAYKEIMELKHEAGRPFPKVFAAAQEAKGQYDMFLDAFKKDGHLPNRVAETDNEAHFINACFSMARVAHRMQAPPSHRARGDVRMLQESVGYYQYIVDYVARNNVEEHRVQAGMCQEMVDLLTEHIDMIRAKEGEA